MLSTPDVPEPAVTGRPPRTGTPQGCAEARALNAYAPGQLATAYGFDRLYRAGVRGRGARVALLQASPVSVADLRRFTNCSGRGTPSLRTRFLDPGPYQSSGEPQLDAQIVTGMLPGLRRLDTYVAAGPGLDQFARLLAAPLSGARPDVVLRAFGACEPTWRAFPARRR